MRQFCAKHSPFHRKAASDLPNVKLQLRRPRDGHVKAYRGRLLLWVRGAKRWDFLFGGRFRKKTEAKLVRRLTKLKIPKEDGGKTSEEIDEWLRLCSQQTYEFRISHFFQKPSVLEGKGQKKTLQTSVCINVSLHCFHFSFIWEMNTLPPSLMKNQWCPVIRTQKWRRQFFLDLFHLFLQWFVGMENEHGGFFIQMKEERKIQWKN